MNNNLNEELLYKANKAILERLKDDAEKLLTSYHESEIVLTNKATALLQVLFPVFVLIFGFIVVEVSASKSSVLLVFSLFEEAVVFVSCYYAFLGLRLQGIGLKGMLPSVMLQEDIVNDEEHYLRVSIFGLQSSITACKESYGARKVFVKKSINALVVGTFLVVIIFVVFELYQVLFPHVEKGLSKVC